MCFDYVEVRWITIGRTAGGYCTVVARLFYDDESEEVIRTLSARRATAREGRQYEIES